MKDFADIAGNFQISHEAEYDFSMPRHHFHSLYEIYFNPTGGISFLVQDRIYEVHPNDMLIFNDRDFHHPAVPPGLFYDRYVVIFRPSFIRDWCTPEANLLDCFENRPGDFCHKIHLDDEQAASFQALLQQKTEPGAFALLSQKLLLAQLLIRVNTLYRLNGKARIPDGTGRIPSIIQPAIAYINEHLSEELSLDELAGMVYRDKYSFSKLFKKATDFAPHEYISLRRILRAGELLRSGMPVFAVCEQVGYKSESHFITKFKSYWGISPKKFALLQQNNAP
ncbi:MAG: helix-turn-helix domain-containing protein [Eubacteriales bacterium]